LSIASPTQPKDGLSSNKKLVTISRLITNICLKQTTQKEKKKKTQTHPNIDSLEPFQVQHLGAE